MHQKIRIGSFTSSRIEIRDIIKAWFIISLAFAILLRGSELQFSYIFIISALTVGIGFLFHELAHKITAQHYGCDAEFRSFDTMLILALIMSFFGFIIAAPGAVFISGPVGRKRNGKISAAGPLMNLVLAFIFLIVLLVTTNKILLTISNYGFMINSWLALFNMLPFGNFDGVKVLKWNKVVYFSMVAVAFIFIII